MSAAATAEPLLSVECLSILLPSGVRLVQDVGFCVARGETVALVGESGCGKSITALGLMGLLPPTLRYGEESSIRLEGTELINLDPGRLRRLRGDRMSMIFQDPLTALNPVMTVGDQITEVLHAHRSISPAEAESRAAELLRLVRIPDPVARLRDYPHRLSGGMRQRVMIAMALACAPALLVADEPTTALDVTVQVQILDLLRELQQRAGLGLVLITHDLGVVARYCDTVFVMYSGSIVESGPVGDVLDAPRHPYTRGLLSARPSASYWLSRSKLSEIPGSVPAADQRPAGCTFSARCCHATAECGAQRPELAGGARRVSCFNPLANAG